MVTGDRNLSHGRWDIEYQIEDAALFVENIGQSPADFEPLLTRLIDTAVVREVAGRTIEEVTRTNIDAVRAGVRERLQDALGRLRTGVKIVSVNTETIEPGAVRRAFLDVTRALNERQTLRDRAEETATEILNRAAGDRVTLDRLLGLVQAYGQAQLENASQTELDELLARIDRELDQAKDSDEAGQISVTLREADANASRLTESIRREYEEFVKYLELRAAQPRIALLGLWVQMRQQILANPDNEIFFVPSDADEIEILINRDPMRAIERERQRVLQRRDEQIRGSGSTPVSSGNRPANVGGRIR